MVAGPRPVPVLNWAIELLPPGPVPIETATKLWISSSNARTASRSGDCWLPEPVDSGSSTCKAEASGFIETDVNAPGLGGRFGALEEAAAVESTEAIKATRISAGLYFTRYLATEVEMDNRFILKSKPHLRPSGYPKI